MADLGRVRHPETAYVALGSNVGERERYIEDARRLVGALPGTRVIAASTIEETAPIGPVPQGNYLNQMVAVETTLTARELLDALLTIERELGRERTVKWGPRTIDLDIVRFGQQVIDSDELVLPHPQIPHRDFWQRELIELRGDWR